MRGGHFVKTLLDEIWRYREKGEIKDGYLSSEQSFSCLQELLDAVDKDSPDEVRISAMKAIFLTAATETMSSRNDPLPQQLMQICRSLSSTDILILSASHKISSGELVQAAKSRGTGGGTTQVWIEHVLKHTGLHFPEIVRLREGPLMEKRLLSPHIYPDGSGFALTNHFRLTELGYFICATSSRLRTLILTDSVRSLNIAFGTAA